MNFAERRNKTNPD